MLRMKTGKFVLERLFQAKLTESHVVICTDTQNTALVQVSLVLLRYVHPMGSKTLSASLVVLNGSSSSSMFELQYLPTCICSRV